MRLKRIDGRNIPRDKLLMMHTKSMKMNNLNHGHITARIPDIVLVIVLVSLVVFTAYRLPPCQKKGVITTVNTDHQTIV